MNDPHTTVEALKKKYLNPECVQPDRDEDQERIWDAGVLIRDIIKVLKTSPKKSRGLSIALTHLETGDMWMNRYLFKGE